MSVELNHTIVDVRNAEETAAFISDIVGLPAATRLGEFTILQVGATSLDLLETRGPIAARHFAFLVDEASFDAVFGRIEELGLTYWADPFRREPNAINHWDDGRGVYFEDPNGHMLEAITRPYGSAGCAAEHPFPLLDC